MTQEENIIIKIEQSNKDIINKEQIFHESTLFAEPIYHY